MCHVSKFISIKIRRKGGKSSRNLSFLHQRRRTAKYRSPDRQEVLLLSRQALQCTGVTVEDIERGHHSVGIIRPRSCEALICCGGGGRLRTNSIQFNSTQFNFRPDRPSGALTAEAPFAATRADGGGILDSSVVGVGCWGHFDLLRGFPLCPLSRRPSLLTSQALRQKAECERRAKESTILWRRH